MTIDPRLQDLLDRAMRLRRSGELPQALEAFLAAQQIAPQLHHLAGLAATVARDLCQIELAAELLDRAIAAGASDAFRLRRATLLSPIIASEAQVERARREMADGLEALLARPSLRIDDPLAELPYLHFYLAYHGRDDRALHQRVGDVLRRACPALNAVADHCRRPQPAVDRRLRVGFFSSHFHAHTIGHLNRRLIELLDRRRFETTVIFEGRMRDGFAQQLAAAADRALIVPRELSKMRRQIAALELDLLYFTDIGMDLASYFLAFSRLAPVQCMTWGHPVTSGLSTVDYFISSEALESVGSEGQYAEALVRLDGPLSVSYPRPPAPQPVTHSELGIDAERRVYLCPQTLFKFHPEFDRALRAILRADSQAVLVLLRPKVPRWGEIKCEQICGGDRSLAERIRFAPPLARERFLGLFALADVVLDPFHFGGGNTTLEALHSGAVVVTLPSAMLRGRISRACYLALGIGDCLAESAEDYVALAIGLAKDRVRRGALQAQIAARVDQLFDQRGPIAAHENFFVEAHRRAVASAGVAER